MKSTRPSGRQRPLRGSSAQLFRPICGALRSDRRRQVVGGACLLECRLRRDLLRRGREPPRRAPEGGPARSAVAPAQPCRARREAVRRSPPRAAAARTPRSTSRRSRAASRRARAVPARRSRRPSRPLPAATRRRCPAIPSAPPKRPSSRLTSGPIRSITPPVPRRAVLARATSSSCAGSPGSAPWLALVTSVCPPGAQPLGEHAAAVGVELGEDVVEQQQRPVPRRSASSSASAEQQREHREALLALRAEAAQVAAGRENADVVEVRPEARRAALEVAVEAGLERRGSRRLALVAQLACGRPSSSARSAKRGAARRPQRARPATSSAPEPTTCSVHGASASRVEKPAPRAAARRCAERPPRRTRPRDRPRAGERRPSTRSKYARRAAGPPLTTARRSGVKTSVATSPRSCSAARSRAPFSVARFPCRAARVTSSSSGTPAAVAAQRDPSLPPAEADELRVGARPRREALRADVQRLEQVRLAGAVRPGHEHEPGRELEVEPRVRAVVPKRDRGDDQPATEAPLAVPLSGCSGFARAPV